MNSEPVRLFDDPSAAAALRADVAHAAAGAVEGLDLAAGAAGLRAAIAADIAAAGATTATTAASGSGAAAASGSGVMKAVLALGLVAGGATAWWTSSPTSNTDGAAVAAAPAAAPVSAAAPAAPAAPVEPVAVQPEVAAPAVVVPPEPEPESGPEPVADEPARPAREKQARGHKRAPSAEVAPSKADDHLKEARLVAEARRSLHTQPKHALELLKEAQRDFPKGMLKEEVEALSILALVELGRDAAATPRAKAFLEQHSKGPYAAAVRRATATSDE